MSSWFRLVRGRSPERIRSGRKNAIENVTKPPFCEKRSPFFGTHCRNRSSQPAITRKSSVVCNGRKRMWDIQTRTLCASEKKNRNISREAKKRAALTAVFSRVKSTSDSAELHTNQTAIYSTNHQKRALRSPQTIHKTVNMYMQCIKPNSILPQENAMKTSITEPTIHLQHSIMY